MDEEKKEEQQYLLVELEGARAIGNYLTSKPLPYAETAPLLSVLERAKGPVTAQPVPRNGAGQDGSTD